LDEAPAEFQVPIPPDSESYIDTVLSRYGVRSQSFAVVVPGTIWPTKHWHIDGFAAVARYLRGTGRAVVLAGSANERERCRSVAERAAGVLDLSGQTTLSELAALIRRAELCVTNDSGSMHLTVALGRPVVSVFGPTDEVWIGPYRRPEAVVRAPKDCAPCYFRQLSDCPHNHACMRDVTPGMVIECIERVLAGTSIAA
jgi:ADP-heptose:LPS heptosyltransferase